MFREINVIFVSMNTNIHIALSVEGNKLLVEPNQPVMFLAGPIRNAPKWHHEAIRHALKANTNTFVAVPIRDVPDDIRPFVIADIAQPTFERQRAWELYYLEKARNNGCVVFWLPKEADVKEFQDKIYAHITMMELGTAIGLYSLMPAIKMVVGTDGEFPEWRTIKLDLDEQEIPICYSLEETINTALKLIHG
jgi:hypothetical protein